MRIGKDALVITNCKKEKTISIGALSMTANETNDTLEIPIVTLRSDTLGHCEQYSSLESKTRAFQIWESRLGINQFLLSEVLKSTRKRGGTTVMIFNLKKCDRTQNELMLNDENDITLYRKINRDIDMMKPVPHTPWRNQHPSADSIFDWSLQQYLSVLFFKPPKAASIYIGKYSDRNLKKALTKVEFLDMGKQLNSIERITSILKYEEDSSEVTESVIEAYFGYWAHARRHNLCGYLLYWQNILIEPFRFVHLTPPKDRHFGYVAVAHLDLEPMNNKQSFDTTSPRYQTTINHLQQFYDSKFSLLSRKLKSNTKSAGDEDEEGVVAGPVDDGMAGEWAVCDLCDKWRRTPHRDYSNVEFTCAHVKKSCDDPEDEEEVNEIVLNTRDSGLDQWVPHNTQGAVASQAIGVSSVDLDKFECGADDFKEFYRLAPPNEYAGEWRGRPVTLTKIPGLSVSELRARVMVMIPLVHPTICQTVFFSQQPILIGTDGSEGATTWKVFLESGERLNFSSARDMVTALWSALAYMHDKNVLHNMITNESVYVSLMNGKYTVKLGGLGTQILAVNSIDDKRVMSFKKGSIYSSRDFNNLDDTLAGATIGDLEKLLFQNDVYSLANISAEMLFLKKIWSKKSNLSTSARKGKEYPIDPPLCLNEVFNIPEDSVPLQDVSDKAYVILKTLWRPGKKKVANLEANAIAAYADFKLRRLFGSMSPMCGVYCRHERVSVFAVIPPPAVAQYVQKGDVVYGQIINKSSTRPRQSKDDDDDSVLLADYFKQKADIFDDSTYLPAFSSKLFVLYKIYKTLSPNYFRESQDPSSSSSRSSTMPPVETLHVAQIQLKKLPEKSKFLDLLDMQTILQSDLTNNQRRTTFRYSRTSPICIVRLNSKAII